jgi:murein DD-endopeptidase MepM/ murein hydrolase activator NlpD
VNWVSYLENGQKEIGKLMKFVSCHDKSLKFTYIKVTLFVLFLSILTANGITPFRRTGDNTFHLRVNGVEVGIVGDVSRAEDMLLTARREIASASSELVFMDANLSYTGEELLYGYLDDEQTVIDRMKAVLETARIETMQRAYTLKVNEYMVDLGSAWEVASLLDAAIHKYDQANGFSVELVKNGHREINVLTAEVRQNQAEDTEKVSEYWKDKEGAGVEAVILQTIADLEPEVEKEFGDYQLGILSMGFEEEVEIVEAYLPTAQLKPLEEAIEEVTMEEEKNTIYKVASGDTLSEIAIKVNIPMEKLVELNDSLESVNTTIREGQELIVTVPEPKLSVERQEENYYEEIYDADVIYIDNDDWFTNQTKVHQEPSAGFRKVIAIESYLNDSEVSREIVKEEVVMDAVAKIVERGTKIPPTYIKPLSGGRRSSGFGRRSAPTKGASSYHKGIDWATPTGTSIVASCGGTVAKAGWGSGYGYVVYINHADGRQTRYGHLSKILVKVGQTVKQGERIALSGNTGVSTGPHVHFEILINGKQVDPLKYLN